jgi:predicted nucleic acid-binding protein
VSEAGSAVVLDTDVYSYLLRTADKRGELYRPHVQGKTIAVAFVTVGELYYGAQKRGWGKRKLALLEQRLRATVIIPYDVRSARHMLR